MSDETKETIETIEAELDLSLEQKIRNDIGAEPDEYKAGPEAEDMDAIIKKKNELLNEKKKEQQKARHLQEELDNFKLMFKQQEQEKLEEKQEYKTLWENTQKEKEDLKAQLTSVQHNLVKKEKIKQFNKLLGTSLNKDRYYDFVDLDSIIVEEEGSVNKDSVKYVVNMFRENYPELVPRQNFPSVGAQSPSTQGIPAQRASTDTASDRKNLRSQLLRNK